MLAVIDHTTETDVAIVDGSVVITHLVESAPEVVRIVQDATEATLAVRDCLRAGARSLAVVRSGLDMAALDRTAAQVEQHVRAAHEEFSREIASAAHELLGEGEAGLPASLRAWRSEVAATLDAAMDPNRRDSLLARVDSCVGRVLKEQQKTLQRLLDPDTEGSPVARMVAATDSRLVPLAEEVRRLRETMVANHATSAALERSAVKGQVYEDFIAQLVIDLASSSGDVGEAVGRSTGKSGGRVGDVTVTCGSARYVVEVKDRRIALPAALAEARAAMTNRDAAAALVVFSGPKACPISAPFAAFDEIAFVQVDKTTPDLLALEVGCAWARSRAQSSTKRGGAVDLALVADAVTQAEDALARATAIRRALGIIRRESDRAAGDLSDLTNGVRDALSRLRTIGAEAR